MTFRCEHIGDATLYLGSCEEVMPSLGDIDVCMTDPPYGCGKAEWDDEFPVDWYPLASAISRRIVVITGSAGVRDSIPLVGSDFIDVISARNLNGMTRGPIGFGNWLAAVIAKSKPRQGVNFFEFTVSADMPDHPSPKPIDYMMKLVERVTEPGELVLDCFMGSGTTGVACVKLGRRFIGIERDSKHFTTSLNRITTAQRQGDLIRDVIARPKRMQEGLPL